MKIDKYIGQAGFTSRRKANELIDEKKVLVNGKVATVSTTVKEGDVVLIDGKEITVKDYVPTYIVYNKPKGIECTSEKIANNIIDAIGHTQNIYPVGRLDKESEGLILLTNHSEIIDKIANSSYNHEKEYIVTLNFPVRKQFLREISEGVLLAGEKVKTKPCTVSLEPNAKRIFRITLTQGLNRQIRRMCTMFDYQVIKLQRVRVMHINLGKLKLGEWRDLTESELETLLEEIN
ncbi:MAG: pseudouridine synthase [Bacteroidetes bacterium]|nr:pseudouridine synthase [Bacteroidota bacterium]